MRKTFSVLSIALACAMAGGLLLGMAPTASAQRFRGGFVVVGPGPFYGPFYPYYGYYPYPGYYMAANYGEIKLETHHMKNDQVFIDGGFAAKIRDASKFALRPGEHNIELRDADNQVVYQEQVAITVGHTTKLRIS